LKLLKKRVSSLEHFQPFPKWRQAVSDITREMNNTITKEYELEKHGNIFMRKEKNINSPVLQQNYS